MTIRARLAVTRDALKERGKFIRRAGTAAIKLAVAVATELLALGRIDALKTDPQRVDFDCIAVDYTRTSDDVGGRGQGR
jgi:hypothetical protein